MSPEQSQATATALGIVALIYLVIAVASIVFTVIVFWKIFAKAGYSGALGLLMLIPIANIVMLCILAFGEWPILKELNYLRQQVGYRGPQPPMAGPPPQYGSPPQY